MARRPVKGQAGVLPQIGACRTLEVMGEAKAVRRQRVAELRRAVIAAHPDHGGTAESLQAALAALRAEQRRKAEVPPPTPSPTSNRPHRPSRPSPAPLPQTLRAAAVGVLKTVAWVYGVALPLVLVLALLVGRANAWLLGG